MISVHGSSPALIKYKGLVLLTSWNDTMDTWSRLLEMEFRQLKDEGFDLRSVEELVTGTTPIKGILELTLIREQLKPVEGYKYREPNSLEEIKKYRHRGPRELEVDRSTVKQRIAGGWMGRIAGCILGKPVEGWPYEKIRRGLMKIGEYPLKYYFPSEMFKDDREKLPLTRGNIQYAERDDDTDYTILNLHIVETYGLRFTTGNIAEEWLTHLPYQCTYTAERVAYRNLVLGIRPPATATFLNPYREWIGARIRADIWGYICPGRPEEAAELAYRDAVLSHTKNGIYGEMFTAATIAAAFSVDTPLEAIEVGLSEIPKTSRLFEAIEYVVKLYKRGMTWEEAIKRIIDTYGKYHPVHVINNTALTVAALLWGEGDFSKTITLAVMGGWDTDCNGATAGSIVGVLCGIERVPRRWWVVFNNTIRSAVMGFDNSRITDLIERTTRLSQYRVGE